MKQFELMDILKYRRQLMGISAIFILICHTIAYVDMPSIFKYIFAFGNIGVDLFFLLSGIGIFYSLSSNKTNTYKWYLHRFKKLMIPYFIIITMFLIIKLSLGLFPNENFWFILRFISTIQFWISHQGVWFIAALIPMYLLAPIFYKLISKNGISAFVLIGLLYVVDAIPLECFNDEYIAKIVANIQFASIRVTCFILGMWIAFRKDRTIPLWILCVMVIAGLLSMLITKHMVYGYFFLCLPLIYAMCLFVKDGGILVNKICNFFGGITLESYLFNGNLPILIITFFSYTGLKDHNNILAYLLAVLLGTLLSYVFSLLIKRVIKI